MTSMERKISSEECLGEMGVEINPNLPMIESPEATKLRSSEEVARRAICLTAVTSRAYGDGKAFLIDYLKRKNCYEYLTEQEVEFINKSRVSKKDEIKYSWQVEALRVLLWSIGYVKLGKFEFQQCDPSADVFSYCSSPKSDGSSFINDAKLIDKEEILNASDLIYRAHWAARQRSIDGKTAIGNLNPGVVLEYHKAINWITCYESLDWDGVTTDT